MEKRLDMKTEKEIKQELKSVKRRLRMINSINSLDWCFLVVRYEQLKWVLEE